MSWLISGKICKEKDIVQALDTIVRQLSLSFQTQTDTLGNAQVNFLHAMIKREKSMSSYETIERFRLGSSSNVQQAKKALLSKEIIDDAHGDIYILDPMYKHWLTNYYFI